MESHQQDKTPSRNPADNLTQADRVRGGHRSAQSQSRDRSGQFAGRRNTSQESQAQAGARGDQQSPPSQQSR
jgi:hypothetical protein